MSVVALRGLGQVALFVRDIDDAVRFYRDTLGLAHLFTAGQLAFFDVAGVRLYLHACSEDDWRASSVLYFTVDDISATYRALETAGVTTAGAPHRIHIDEAAGVEEWMAFFDDPDGNTLGLMSKVPISS